MAGGQKTIVAELSRTIDGVKSGLEELQKSLTDLQKSSTGWTQSFISGLRQSQSQLAETKRGFDKLSATIQRSSAVPGVVQGARISQALGATTGQGPASGGGGRAQAFASGFARSALSPIRFGLPAVAGALAQLPFVAAGGLAGGAGGALSGLRGGGLIGSVMKGIGGFTSGLGRHIARPVVEGVTHAALGFGTQYIQQAMSMREQMEGAGRFLGRRGGQAGNLADVGLRHGYDVMQTLQHRESTGRAIGGASPQEGMIQAMSNRLRQPVGSVVGAAGALRGGGMDSNAIAGVLQRIEAGVSSMGFDRNAPAFMHRTEALLQSIAGFAQQQVSIAGTVNERQTSAFQTLAQSLTGRKGSPIFSPQEATRRAQQLMNVRMNPGGGEAGELFVQRALGFGNPNLDAQRRAAQELGINPNLIRRRSLFEMRRLREDDPETADKLIRSQMGAEFPGSQMQAWILDALGGTGFKAAEMILNALGKGTGAGVGGLPVGSSQQVGEQRTTGQMGFDPQMLTVLQKYHKSLATLAGIPGGIQGIKDLAELVRTLQTLGGTATAVTFKELFGDVGKEVRKYLRSKNTTINKAIVDEIQGISKIIKDLLKKTGITSSQVEMPRKIFTVDRTA